MRLDVLEDADAASAYAAAVIAADARAAVAARGRAAIALSGGTTPAGMLRQLARQDLPWPSIDLFQVDERLVAADDPRRNLAGLLAAFAASALPRERIHAMPVELDDPLAAARSYAELLGTIVSVPPVLDVVHLGLGLDGHTASLVPGDEALDSPADVAVTGSYEGTRRMTLTMGMLDRARRRVWLVTGGAKRQVLAQLLGHDATLIGARVTPRDSIVVADRAARGEADRPMGVASTP